MQAAEADLTALAEGTVRTLRVGTFQSVSIRVLPDAVRALIEERPGIEVRLQEASWDHELLGLVERGRLDITFATTPPVGPFEHLELIRDPYVLLTRTGSALAQARVVPTLAEIGRMPLIAYSRSTYGIEGTLRDRGHRAERRLPDRRERRSAAAASQQASASRSWRACRSTAEIPGVVAVDASRRVPARTIGLVWHRDATLSEAAETFIAAAKARCDELSRDLAVIS